MGCRRGGRGGGLKDMRKPASVFESVKQGYFMERVCNLRCSCFSFLGTKRGRQIEKRGKVGSEECSDWQKRIKKVVSGGVIRSKISGECVQGIRALEARVKSGCVRILQRWRLLKLTREKQEEQRGCLCNMRGWSSRKRKEESVLKSR
jgi:hypothetical protein